ncbi:STAS domain-containing protein [Marinobacterium arenosum]|uniref:STAS domain-containing protein n=1 Tax=Marinobacterium arenosum TaxID=2862496 RepID=UPI001C9402BF|nr:STAS domain-containing protein [Marinobacterium arenosum]MBY4678011.1 STAS domain-containing protein [Marinobacterium arenosum]
MAISTSRSDEGNSIIIRVSDRFDFSLHQDFRDSYQSEQAPGTSFALDLQDADYMDSSALGMILLLKEHAETLGGNLVIRHPNQTIRKILDIAKFERFITIEG